MIAGKKFPLDKDEIILKINSPKDKVKGPYCVVVKDLKKRWAIVALRWDNRLNSLGIRWFHDKAGFPFNRQSTWFIIPKELESFVFTLLKDDGNKAILSKFLYENDPKGGKELKANFHPEKEH